MICQDIDLDGVLKRVAFEVRLAAEKHPHASFIALVEEVGEVAKAIQEEGPKQFRDELVQVACVAVRLVMKSMLEERAYADVEYDN